MTKNDTLNTFIPLARTFHELLQDAAAGDDADLRSVTRRGELLWKDLLITPRVVLLSEAGSGKTAEIRYACRRLRDDGLAAFFIRIEHVVQSFEDAFEEGSYEEFLAWTSSGNEGWLLLDSVDEARLRDPKDFERAVLKLGRKLAPVLQQAHIVITGRATAWRPKTDLLLVKQAFFYELPSVTVTDDTETQAIDSVGKAVSDGKSRDAFRIVALDDLHGEQVDRFAEGKGVADIEAFRTALDRKDAWSLTTRPQDLAELADFWNKHQSIGSRLDLMTASINRRLEETDQDRSEAQPMALDRLRYGARLVAAASTLTHESSIRVPDGAQNNRGLAVKQVLTDWNDAEIGALLGRPIFDEGIYGTVRFHHRSVREYLTAEWLQTLIVNDASRARIEGLFFRTQYDLEVIVPTMRPVLPWLCLLDARILARTCQLAPEVLFEGGDPSKLPRDTRVSILRQTCEQLSQPAHSRSMMDYSAVQRFAHSDLTDEINTLLARYGDDEDIASFLLRMVWCGEIAGAIGESKRLALYSRSKYSRITAIRALVAVGSPADIQDVRDALLADGDIPHRDWAAELLPGLPPNAAGTAWLLQALAQSPSKPRFEVDNLSHALRSYVDTLALEHLSTLVAGLQQLLSTPPVIERRHREISVRFGWLGPAALQAVARLIVARHPYAMDRSSLWVLRSVRMNEDYDENAPKETLDAISNLVPKWSELNRLLFWFDVAATRTERAEDGTRFIDYWPVGMYGRHWAFDSVDFDAACADIGAQTLDDRFVALQLAFDLYRRNGRPAAWRRRLKRAAGGDAELGVVLHGLLHPPPSDLRKWQRQERSWKKKAERRAARQIADRLAWKKHVQANMAAIRGCETPSEVSQVQLYLHHQLSDERNSDKWGYSDWRKLDAEFGSEVAEAFRDGAIGYWRKVSPKLRSEGAASNSTPFSVIFGLSGVSIETIEKDRWTDHLTSADAKVATRYAVHELNGFPPWINKLYEAFPVEVVDVLMQEVDYELKTDGPDSESHYVLYDIAWRGSQMWDKLGPAFFSRLGGAKIGHQNLGYMLEVVTGSPIADDAIAKLAARKARTVKQERLEPMWFAVWCGVNPAVAIPALESRLAELKTPQLQTQFAMHFALALVGGRRFQKGHARQGYRTVSHMKTLYLLMHHYVRRQEDIERQGKGVYSPGLRDDAQDARNALASFIHETPGKEAFLAMMEIAETHPDESSRPWATYRAKSKATQDADIAPWSADQVRDFHDRLERTPNNHCDLWYLGVDRLADLKNALEQGDDSISSILLRAPETEIRNYVGNWCRDRARGRYVIPQEEELADAKRPDLRFHGVGFDAPVPVELKLADNWTGPHLFERLENQLCGDYLRDGRSSRGIFGLFYLGRKKAWELPSGRRADSFDELVHALRDHWNVLSTRIVNVEDINVFGIDLTKRAMAINYLTSGNK